MRKLCDLFIRKFANLALVAKTVSEKVGDFFLYALLVSFMPVFTNGRLEVYLAHACNEVTILWNKVTIWWNKVT